MSYTERMSSADVLRPPILNINGINYRRNIFLKQEVCDETLYRMKDLEEAFDPYEDECCNSEDFHIEEYSEGFKTEMQIPTLFHRFLVGHKGETRRKIEAETAAKVILPPRGKEGDIVVKGRDIKSVSSACTRIMLIVENEKKEMPFTHFLSFSIASGETMKGFEEFKDQVLNKCKANGIDESIFQNPKKLHLTLGVLVLIDSNDMDRAKEILKLCKQDLTDKGLLDAPFDVMMSGLEYMNDDPSSVDVLYAKVRLDDGSDRLQVIADHLAGAFTSSGLMRRQFDGRVKLHATVMNTLFRRGCDDDGDFNQRQQQQQRRNRERFDATLVLRNLRDHNFGETRVTEVHVSRMHSVDGSSGYYVSDASMEL